MSKKNPKTDLEFEITFYEGILSKRPGFPQAMMMLGDLYTQKGWYEKGLGVDRQLADLKPDDPFVFYNLACDYSLLGRMDDAFNAIKTAFRLGYDDFEFLQQDRDLENLREDRRFQDSLCRWKKALTRRKSPQPDHG